MAERLQFLSSSPGIVPLPYVINLTPQITMACKASKIVEKSEGGEKQDLF